MRKSRGEHLNPAFALQRHTAPKAGVMVWVAIANDTRSLLILIHGTMTASGTSRTSFRHMCCHLWQGFQEPFLTRQCSATNSQDITRLPPPHYHRSLAYLIPRFVTNPVYLESFGKQIEQPTSLIE
ncbi:hypothetical protein TNCV_4891641 [Trichonephila clavipes]|nr:hypothetical protein TNCV_4891641 [Trichonephila clavipes]